MKHWCEMGEENLLQLQINNIALCDKVFEIATIDPNISLFRQRMNLHFHSVVNK